MDTSEGMGLIGRGLVKGQRQKMGDKDKKDTSDGTRARNLDGRGEISVNLGGAQGWVVEGC